MSLTSSVNDEIRAMRFPEEREERGERGEVADSDVHAHAYASEGADGAELEEDEWYRNERAMTIARRGDAAADHLLAGVRRNIRSRHVRADEVDIRNILRRETRANTRDMKWVPRSYQPPG